MITTKAPCPSCKARGGQVLIEISGVEEIECFHCGTFWQRVSPDVIKTDSLAHYVETGDCE